VPPAKGRFLCPAWQRPAGCSGPAGALGSAEEGIEAWLDKWNLIPGDPWQPAIEEALQKAESCVVFVGYGGFGSWQTEEMRAAINRRVTESNKRFRVIPVLLPGVEQPERSSLPPFLVAATWVEFHGSIDDQDAFHRLVYGIRGLAPGPGPRRLDPPVSPRTTHNLPFAPNPAFTGREADLERLGEFLQKRDEAILTQAVVLHGLGGVGKTQLAIEYAWKHLGGYEAVLWVRADSPQTLDASLAGLAGVLGLPEVSVKEQDVQTDAVLRWLKRTMPIASCPMTRPLSVCSIVLYGQRSLPQMQARVTVTTASVGSIRRASGTFSIRTSPAPNMTVARIAIYLRSSATVTSSRASEVERSR
jgi:hypothetical protein